MDSQGKPINSQPHADQIMGAEIKLQHGNQMHIGKVRRRKIGEDGKTVGHCNPIPILNTLECEVEFQDGTAQSPLNLSIKLSMLGLFSGAVQIFHCEWSAGHVWHHPAIGFQDPLAHLIAHTFCWTQHSTQDSFGLGEPFFVIHKVAPIMSFELAQV